MIKASTPGVYDTVNGSAP